MFMTRDIPMRTRIPKKKIEQDHHIRTDVVAAIRIPDGTPAFKEGYLECIQLYALHAPNKRQVGRILDEYCIILEEECLRSNLVRDSMSRYEGYRQAIKDLKKLKKIM